MARCDWLWIGNKRDIITVTLFLGWKDHDSHAEGRTGKVTAVRQWCLFWLFFFPICSHHLPRALCKVIYFAAGSPPSASLFLDWEQWGCWGRTWEQRPNITDADSMCPNSSTVVPRTHLKIHITPHLPPIDKEHNFAHMQSPPTVNFLSQKWGNGSSWLQTKIKIHWTLQMGAHKS